MSEKDNNLIEKNKLKSESSVINYTKKYSNYILPTVGGIIGFFCLNPIISLAGGSLASIGMYSSLKTTTLVAGTSLATIGGNKINQSIINKSSWNNIITDDEINKISENIIVPLEINKFHKYFSESLFDIENNNYILYKRFDEVFRNKHYNNLINNIIGEDYDEIIYDSLSFIHIYTNLITKIYKINDNYIIENNIQNIVEKKFMNDYYDYIYSIIKKNKNDLNKYISNIKKIHDVIGIHKCSKILDVKDLFLYRLDFKFYIEMLESLQYTKCSNEKMMQILEIFKLLYKDIESEFNNSEISADILVPIICILVIKSKSELLPIELEYISLFFNDKIDDGENGYVFTTLKLAVNIIIDFDKINLPFE